MNYSNAYVWAKVISYLDERMSPGIVSTYFDQSYILEMTDQKMTVYAPSEFCKEVIEGAAWATSGTPCRSSPARTRTLRWSARRN